MRKSKLWLLMSLGICTAVAFTSCGEKKEASTEPANQVESQSGDMNNQDAENSADDATKTTDDSANAADSTATDAQSADAADESVELSEWNGKWNNICQYMDDENLQAAFEEFAKNNNITVDEAKKQFTTERGVDFGAVDISGDTITFLDTKEDGAKEVEKVQYKFVKKFPIQHDGEESFWAEFDAVDENAKHKVLICMPIHGEDEITHFHMRYGDNAEDLLAKEDWYPTIVDPKSTTEQLYAEIAG